MYNKEINLAAENYIIWLKYYKENGFVIIRDLISPDLLIKLRGGLNKIVNKLAIKLENKEKKYEHKKNLIFEKKLAYLTRNYLNELPLLYRSELHQHEFYSLFSNPKLFSVIFKILRNNKEIRIYPNYSSRPKTGNLIHNVTWHQDAALRSDGGPSSLTVTQRIRCFGISSMINCWLPLIHTNSKTGAMKFIPKGFSKIYKHTNVGSYLSNFIKAPTREDEKGLGGETNSSPGTYMTAMSLKIMKDLLNKHISIECDPGEIVLFNNLLVHRGGINVSEKIRWSIDWRYQDAKLPTLRQLNGHVLFSKKKFRSVQNAREWAKRSLT